MKKITHEYPYYGQTYVDNQLVMIERRESYGNVRYYPLNTTAWLLTELSSNEKTLTKTNLKTIEELGYEIDIATPEIDWREE